MADPNLPNVVTSLGSVKPHVYKAAVEITHRWVLYFVWGYANKKGDHGVGLALDFMTYEFGGGVPNPGPRRDWVGDQIAAYVLANRVRLGVTYVIWDRRIASAKSNPPWSWRPYDGSNPHIDHPHVSFEADHTYQPPEDDMPLTDADAHKVAAAVWAHRLNPGPYADRLGGYDPDETYPAGALLVGADTGSREDRAARADEQQLWGAIKATLEAVRERVEEMAGEGLSDEDRTRLAQEVAERVNPLYRIVLERTDGQTNEQETPS